MLTKNESLSVIGISEATWPIQLGIVKELMEDITKITGIRDFFFVNMKAPIVELLIDPEGMAMDKAVFSPASLDKKFDTPKILSNTNIKDILFAIYKRVPELKFNPYKIGVNLFETVPLNTPTELLKYVENNICRRVLPGYITTYAFKGQNKTAGIGIIMNIDNPDDLAYISKTFRSFYHIKARNKALSTGSMDFKYFSEMPVTLKGNIKAADVKDLLEKIIEDQNLRIPVPGLNATAPNTASREPVVEEGGKLRIGKCIFGTDKPWGKSEYKL